MSVSKRPTPLCDDGAHKPGALRLFNRTRHCEIATAIIVADHGTARTKGLLGRRGLHPGEGLWLVPCEAIHTFGMKFPIDLVYLDRKHRVRKVRSNVPPWRLSACITAHSVIELAAGAVRATQTDRGDELEFSSAS